MEDRGVNVDHGTLNRWVVKFAPLLATQAQSRKKLTAKSWRMDETYIKVKGKWTYYVVESAFYLGNVGLNIFPCQYPNFR